MGCGDLFEIPWLLQFLKESLLDTGRVSQISVFGSDVEDSAHWWRCWQEWAVHNIGPRVKLEMRKQDLQFESPPRSTLILGIHPEVCSGGPWHAILINVLQSC